MAAWFPLLTWVVCIFLYICILLSGNATFRVRPINLSLSIHWFSRKPDILQGVSGKEEKGNSIHGGGMRSPGWLNYSAKGRCHWAFLRVIVQPWMAAFSKTSPTLFDFFHLETSSTVSQLCISLPSPPKLGAIISILLSLNYFLC